MSNFIRDGQKKSDWTIPLKYLNSMAELLMRAADRVKKACDVLTFQIPEWVLSAATRQKSEASAESFLKTIRNWMQLLV